MATDALKGIGTVKLNTLEMCITSWEASETGTENDTTSTCDGDGQSSDIVNPTLTITGEAFYSDSRPYHDTAQWNLRVNGEVDVEAYIGPVADNRKYTMTNAKVIEWRTRSQVKGHVTVSFTIKSQGDDSNYTCPTT